MKKKDQILLEEAYNQILESPQPWVSDYSNRSADLREPSAEKQKSDKLKAEYLAKAVTQFTQEPKLSELAKHYDPQGIYKKDPTPEQVKHDLKYLAFGNKRAQYSVIDPKQFQAVYRALQKKLEQLKTQTSSKPLGPMKGEAPSKQIARDLHNNLTPFQRTRYNLTGKH
jgi:hypothetical protein